MQIGPHVYNNHAEINDGHYQGFRPVQNAAVKQPKQENDHETPRYILPDEDVKKAIHFPFHDKFITQ